MENFATLMEVTELFEICQGVLLHIMRTADASARLLMQFS